MRSLTSAGLALAVGVFALGAPAQETSGSPPPAPARASAKVVVVADAAADETDNARLRAKIYEALRSEGLSPDPKLDVTPAAESAGAMKDGRLSSDEAELEKVRQGLGVAVLVRVARTDKGIVVVVVREGAAKTRTVAGADEVPAVARELAGGGGKKAEKAPEPAPPAAATSANSSAGGSITSGFMTPAAKPEPQESEEPELTDPKALAAAWDNRGGLRASYGVSALLTGLIVPEVLYAGTNPDTGQLEVGKGSAYGIGGGIGVRVGMIYLPIPQPKSGGTSWAAFRLGVGLDVSGLYVRSPRRYSYKLTNNQVSSRDTDYENAAYIYGVAPLELGVNFGFGDFKLPTLWRGFAFGLAYAPAFVFSLKVGQNQNATDSRFNYAGFEANIDVVKFEAARGSQPQIRFSALVLPRVKNDLPWLTSLGIGVIWY